MTVKDILSILDAKLICGDVGCYEKEVNCACGSDLMSDVMAFVKDKVVLLTGLMTPQAIRTADIMDIEVIVFVRGKYPSEDMVELAKEKHITLLYTTHPMFIACGRLYSAGLTQGGTRKIEERSGTA